MRDHRPGAVTRWCLGADVTFKLDPTRFSYWDSAIIAAARALGCGELYTEDMSHGRQVDGVMIINPFR